LVLLSQLIAGGGLPIEIVAVAELSSGRGNQVEGFKPNPKIAAGADPAEGLKVGDPGLE
jgi:hypothetical protein